MVVTNCNSLVLIGSTVLRGGKAGNPRLGASSTAFSETPEIRTSLRHPSRNAGQEFQPAARPGHADYCRMDAWAVPGAGRSLRCAGVLTRRGLSGLTTTTGTVLSTGRTVETGGRIALAWCKRASRMLPASK